MKQLRLCSSEWGPWIARARESQPTYHSRQRREFGVFARVNRVDMVLELQQLGQELRLGNERYHLDIEMPLE